MKNIRIILLLLLPVLAAFGAQPEKPNTVFIHPGEVIYAKFEPAGELLKLVSASKEKDDQAQLVLTMQPFDEKERLLILKVESKFKKDMTYKAEMRLLSRNRQQETSVAPVRAGLMSFESWPHPIEELALYGFTLKP